ncbi:MAG: 2-deoxy-D-gluconate 3-dehydrogenase, partial [Rhodopseudomonas palustris]|nr:2-deoxy-D-gluconate 3-dehydrogenase [Rhodopseudomonas palustris]
MITGASQGLGKQFAHVLASHGAASVAVDSVCSRLFNLSNGA